MIGIELLKAVRAKISDKERWTREVFARSADGYMANPCSQYAVCWCVVGAAMAITESDKEEDLGNTGWYDVMGKLDPIIVNDSKGHQAVLDMLDKRIAQLEAER